MNPCEERASEAFDPAVEEALVDELYARSRTSFVGLALVLVLLRVLLEQAFQRSVALQGVWWSMFFVLAARVGLVLAARRKQGFFADTRRRHVAFGVGSVAIAVGLALMNVLAFPHVDAVQLAMLAVCQTGINAIALVSLGSSPVLYHTYMLPNLLPMAFVTAAGPHAAALRLLPVMIVLFITVLSTMSLHEYRSRRDNTRLRLQIAEMALVDALTKLRNRRYLQEFMASEVEQVLRDWSGGRGEGRRRLSVMMVDLDRFKEVNDLHGHDAGDAVLQQLGAILRDTVRKQDVVARWGGEEFVIVARDVDHGPGSALAERIRTAVEAHAFALPGGAVIRRTCSIGYSVFPFWPAHPRALRWDDVLALADAGLYRAKQGGRNRVVGILAGENVVADSLDTVRNDVDRASERGLVRVVAA